MRGTIVCGPFDAVLRGLPSTCMRAAQVPCAEVVLAKETPMHDVTPKKIFSQNIWKSQYPPCIFAAA